MNPKGKEPDKIIRVGGQEFRLYKVYDVAEAAYVLNYPDFKENPMYTGAGQPFRTATDEGCPHGKPKNPEHAEPGDYSAYGDCGGCIYFYREETPWDIIGVCKCDAYKRPDAVRKSKEEEK